MGYRFLNHTADVQVECQAEDFRGILESAAQALYALALREPRSGGDVVRVVNVSKVSREEALVRWLQDLIFLLDVDRFVATRFLFDTANESAVSARLEGYQCEPEERAEEVKSATYHELEVRETGNGLVARVIFDL